MIDTWAFDADGPECSGLSGPVPLNRTAMGLPARPGMYLVTSGRCLAHVGTSSNLRTRVGMLARLGTHRGSAEVLCAAYCTRSYPSVWWEEAPTTSAARERESQFKRYYGEPPSPRATYARCVNGAQLLKDFVAVVGPDSWEAGYAVATLAIGEQLKLLFASRFASAWKQLGTPPGPWLVESGE